MGPEQISKVTYRQKILLKKIKWIDTKNETAMKNLHCTWCYYRKSIIFFFKRFNLHKNNVNLYSIKIFNYWYITFDIDQPLKTPSSMTARKYQPVCTKLVTLFRSHVNNQNLKKINSLTEKKTGIIKSKIFEFRLHAKCVTETDC